MIEKAAKILKSVFGYDEFISLQQEVIQNVLGGADTLAVMPTGGGKSVCYQVPALLFEGTTVVVSPLISLMKDQVEQLAELSIPSAMLNSALPAHEYRKTVGMIQSGALRLLYVAPETILKPRVLALLRAARVPLLAIDEAHCISEWGPDFRPEYRRLTEARECMPGAVCIALTATATPRVRADIAASLGFSDSNQFVASFNRENLLLRVVPKDNAFRQTVELLKKFPNDSGIIYCMTRKGVDDLCAALLAKGFSACPYHAGLGEAERSLNQERFVRDEVRVIVATIAFGMGINKSNVRFVLHYDLPRSIESYYQEIGRAGRDGMKSECLLLFSAADMVRIRNLIKQKEGTERRAAQMQVNAMVEFAETEACRRVPLLGYFGETFPAGGCGGMCDNCLDDGRELVDVTVAAQKFLSCIWRTGERFGAVHVIDVLRGSKSARVMRLGHQKLSTYGIGTEYTAAQWRQIARQFVHQGLAERDRESGGLSLTPQAREIFRGNRLVFAKLDAPEPPQSVQKPSEAGEAPVEGSEFQYDTQLFEILRAKRRETASAAAVPPYVIFSDRTLAEMAAYFPQTSASMEHIHGVGEAKLEKYGDIFSSVIADYCLPRGIEEKRHPTVVKKPSRHAKSGSLRMELIGEAFNSGMPLEELANKFNIKPETVLNHLWRYLLEGRPVSAQRIRELITIPGPLLEEALAALDRLGTRYLKPIYEALDERVSYDELRLIRMHYLALCGPSIPDKKTEAARTAGIVCLANSRKYSGRCIAGKEILPAGIGGWIRPIGQAATGELSLSEIMLHTGAEPALLDIIGLRVGEESRTYSYQPENRFCGNGWSFDGTLPRSSLSELVDDVDLLWINGYQSYNGINDRIPIELVEQHITSSLLFVPVEDLHIIAGKDVRGLSKIWADFHHKAVKYRLHVTDPVIEAEYMTRNFGRYPVDDPAAYLTLSIGEPFEGFCYKLAAAVLLSKNQK